MRYKDAKQHTKRLTKEIRDVSKQEKKEARQAQGLWIKGDNLNARQN